MKTIKQNLIVKLIKLTVFSYNTKKKNVIEMKA